jgi:hypothetical protein
LLINSTSAVNFNVSTESLKGADILNDYIIINAKNSRKNDVLSVTIVVNESNGNSVTESRGYSTLVLLS